MPDFGEFVQSLPAQTLPAPTTKYLSIVDPATGAVTRISIADLLALVSGGGNPTIQTLTDGATITMNVANGAWAKVTLGGNRTFVFSGLTAGAAGLIFITQDATGGRTLSWPGASEIPTNGLGLSTGAGELTVVGYIYDGANIILSKENYGVSVPGDVTPPVRTSISVANSSKDYIDIVYNEVLSSGSIPATSAFTVPGKTVIGVTLSGGVMIRVQVSVPFAYGDTPTISYTAGASPIQDTSGNLAPNFSAQTVANNIAAPGDVTAPTRTSMTVENAAPDEIVIAYNETLDSGSVPAVGAFSASGGRTVTAVNIAAISNVVTVTVDTPYVFGDVITLSYTAGASPIQDTSGNNAANFTAQSVTNNVSVAYDTDAQAYFTALEAAGYTFAGGEKDAIEDLVVGLKADGLWAKQIAVYPFIGSTYLSHKWNLKNPLDTNGAYRLSSSGANIVHTANGVTSGATSYLDTNIGFSAVMTATDFHMAAYNRNAANTSATANFIGAGTSGTSLARILTNYVGNMYFNAFASTGAGDSLTPSNGGNTSGLFTMVRRSSTEHEGYQGATSKATSSVAYTGTVPPDNIRILNSDLYSQCCFASIGSALSDAEVTSLNSRVSTYNTALSR